MKTSFKTGAMKKILITFCLLVSATFISYAQPGMSQNPYVNQGIASPSPMLPVEFNGTGELSFNVGNTGSDPLPLVVNQEMGLIITLSYGIPNNADPIAALGGTWVGMFDWTYDAGITTYTATQNQEIPADDFGTITIQYEVTQNSPITDAQNGFNVNLQPPPYTNGSNITDDDQVSSYTYVKAFDYGDAPLSYGSVYHEINVFRNIGNTYYLNYAYLGSSVDAEAAYFDSAADGDDNDGTDDEDGVVFPALIQGATVIIPVTFTIEDWDQTFNIQRLNAWIDWNGDDDFLDAGERIASNITIDYFDYLSNSGTVNLTVMVPIDAIISEPTYARFRFGSATTTPTSIISTNHGEVEDYEIEIESLLAVDFLRFEGFYIHEHAELTWEVENSVNTDYYVLERKDLNDNSYEVISKHASTPLSANIYTYNDYHMEADKIYLYRVKEYDTDGSITTSRTIVLRTEANSGLDLKVYPNPVDFVFNIELSIVSKTEVFVELFDELGRKVKGGIMTGQYEKGNHTQTVDAKELIEGVYILKASMGEDKIVKRITVVR